MIRHALALTVVLAACTDHRAPIMGTQSLQITLTSPTDTGTLANRLPATARTVSAQITAMGPDGKQDMTFDHPLQVYVQFLGTLTPYIGDTPLATVTMTGGAGTLSNFTLPPVFGPATLWFEDACYMYPEGTGSQATSGCATGTTTYATGSSPTLWYPDPFIADIRCSTDPATCAAQEGGATAYEVGPIDNKNVSVNTSRYGAQGRLVITSTYAQGYTLADVKCQDAAGTPPCTSSDYDYIDVYSYSAPLDQEKRFLNEGQVVDGFAGGVSEFDGLLEIGFPQTFYMQDAAAVCSPPSATCNTALEPKPDPTSQTCTDHPASCMGNYVLVDQSWFTNTIYFKRNESNNIEVDNAVICNLDSAFAQYKEWHLDLSGVGGNCSGNLVDVVSAGIFDPTPYIGMKLPKIIGNERSINIGTFHVWIIYPRSMSDITLP